MQTLIQGAFARLWRVSAAKTRSPVSNPRFCSRTSSPLSILGSVVACQTQSLRIDLSEDRATENTFTTDRCTGKVYARDKCRVRHEFVASAGCQHGGPITTLSSLREPAKRTRMPQPKSFEWRIETGQDSSADPLPLGAVGLFEQRHPMGSETQRSHGGVSSAEAYGYVRIEEPHYPLPGTLYPRLAEKQGPSGSRFAGARGVEPALAAVNTHAAGALWSSTAHG